MKERYWLVLPNGGRQFIDPRHFDLNLLAARAREFGGRLIVEGTAIPASSMFGRVSRSPTAPPAEPYYPLFDRILPLEPVPAEPIDDFELPLTSLGPLFRLRLEQIHDCKIEYVLDMNRRPTVRMLGGYYKKRRLVRVYTQDRVSGRRPMEELFDTFLHEIAHHLEYTEPHTFNGHTCGRVHGRMHSPLFWNILGDLKHRWAKLQHECPDGAGDTG